MPNDRPVNRDRYGRLLPGTATPNPGGRPRVPDELRAIFEAASPEAARRLAELVHDEDPRVALVASNAILDRVLGRPAQQINADIKTGSISDAHLAALKDIPERRDRMLQIDAEPTKN